MASLRLKGSGLNSEAQNPVALCYCYCYCYRYRYRYRYMVWIIHGYPFMGNCRLYGHCYTDSCQIVRHKYLGINPVLPGAHRVFCRVTGKIQQQHRHPSGHWALPPFYVEGPDSVGLLQSPNKRSPNPRHSRSVDLLSHLSAAPL